MNDVGECCHFDLYLFCPFPADGVGEDEFEDFLLHRIVGKQAQESLGLLVLVTGNVHHVDFDDVVCHQVT